MNSTTNDKNTKIKSTYIERMDKLHLINTDVKEFTKGTRKKIRDVINIRNEKALIKLAGDSGIDLGVRQSTKEKRAYKYFAELVNERILEAREDKKKPITKIIKIKKSKKEINLGRDVDPMYEKIKNIKNTARVFIRDEGGTIHYETILDRNNKKSLSQQFYDFIMDDSDYTKLWVLKTKYNIDAEVFMVMGVKAKKGKKIFQYFKEGSFNCVLKPIKEFFEDKIENAQTKKTKQNYVSRLNKVMELNEQYFDKGIDENSIADVSNKLQIDINISLPFQDNYISVKSQKKPLRSFNYRNTKLNHVEYDILYYEDNVIELTQKELDQKIKELKNKNEYITYKRSLLHITEIRTIDTIYRTANPYREAVLAFEIENNLLECKICDIKNKDISAFVRQGCHLNQAIDGADWNTQLKYGVDFEHIDQKRAYAKYKMCKYYKGFLGKITDFRKCNKIVDVGYYRIENIKFNNQKLKAYNDWLKIWSNYNVYPSCELEYLMDNGVSFDIIEGCWGSVIDFDFNDVLLEGKTDDNIRYYCKYVGSMMCGNLTNSFFIKGDDAYLDNITNEVSYDSCIRYPKKDNSEHDELRVIYNKSSNYHSSHIAGFITSYMRLNMLEQLEQFEPSDIYRIACDGIYFKSSKPYDIKNCFRIERKDPTHNKGCASYISNDQDYKYIAGERLKVGEWRENNKIEVHTGQGGAGKTHYNLMDKGFINPCFYAPSYKLARNKENDYNCKVSVSQKLTTIDPTMIGIQRRFNSVLIIDEVSMMSNEDKEYIIKTYPTCKIIFCGDIGYQLPCFENNTEKKKETRKTPFSTKDMIVIEHNKNFRVECDKLFKILTNCREMMKQKKEIKNYVFDEFETVDKDNMNYDYKNDIIISATHKGKDFFTEKYKHQEKYYITKSDRVYGRGEILIEKPTTNDYQIQHAYTCHSIQGETAKNKVFIDKNCMYENTMIYTAISRAKRFNQIVFIN